MKAVINRGVEDVSTDKQKKKGITWMQIQKPWTAGTMEDKFRKTACADKTSMFVVECSGGCEGMEYIKLGADVIEGVVCYYFVTLFLAKLVRKYAKMLENVSKCL